MNAEQALAELGRANAEIKRLTGYLVKSLQAMQDAQTGGRDDVAWTDWLAEAYKMEFPSQEDTDQYGEDAKKYYSNHDGDVAAYLHAHCQYALNAHLVIQERKAARKQLAIARRRITLMARHLASAQP